MTDVGWAGLGIIPTFDKFGPELEKGTSRHMLAAGTAGGTKFGDAAGRSAGSRFGSLFRTAAKASLVGLAGASALAVKIGKDSVVAASDLNETLSKTSQIFGSKALPALEKFADGSAEALGQSKQSALDAVSTFGVMGKVAGLQGPKLTKFSKNLTTLSSDMASFGNTTPEEAIEAIGAALRGEAEPIRKYGVLLDDATLKAEALALGILKPVKDEAKIKSYHAKVLEGQQKYNDAVAEFGPKSLEAIKAEANLGTAQAGLAKATEGSIGSLTSQQKVLAANSAIFKQTADQQGDFTRTSDGLANQQRILAAQFDNAKTKLGQGLLPVVTDVVKFLTEKGLPVFDRFAEWFGAKGAPAIGDFAEDIKPLVKTLLPAMGDALKIARDSLEEAVPFAKDVVEAFNNLPDGVKKGLVVGGGLIAARKLLGGGSSGAGGVASQGILGATKGALVTKSGEFLADKLLAKFQKPLPVFVVNQIPGAGGAGAGATAAGAATGGKKPPLALGGKALPGLAAGIPLTMAQYGPGEVGSAMGGKIVADDWEDYAASLDRAAGSADDFRVEIFGLKPEVEGLGVKVRGARDSTKDFNDVLSLVPPEKRVTFKTDGLLAALTNTREYRRELEKLNAVNLVEAGPFDFLLGGKPPGRMNGGPVERGRPYIVGERRPEVFVPSERGRIVPNTNGAAKSGNTFNHYGDIVANDPRDYVRWNQRRSHLVSGGGVDF